MTPLNRSYGHPYLFLLLLFALLVFPVSHAAGEQRLRIAYMPILPSAHEFVAAEKGWYRTLGLPLEELRFNAGPPIVRSLAVGEVDVAYFGSAPAMTAVNRGIKGKIIAAAITEQVAVVAHKTFADLFDQTPTPAAFKQFQLKHSRRLRIASYPTGATPAILLHYWLHQLQVDMLKDVEIVAMGEERLSRAVLSRQVDAAMMVEPAISLVRRDEGQFRPIVYGREILKGHPGSVLFVRQNIIDDNPEIAEGLVRMQLNATKILIESKDEAAGILARKIGSDVLPINIAREVLKSKAARWVANPRAIVDGTLAYKRFQVSRGLSRSRVATEELFDFRFYDRVVSGNPELKKY